MADAQGAPRLLAVTSSPTLVIGLTFLPDGWVIESQPTADGPLDADVVVFDLGSTAAGIAAAAALLPPTRAVVLGDEDPSEPLEHVRFVRRPFTLDELRCEIEVLLMPSVVYPDVAIGPERSDADLTGARVEASAGGGSEARRRMNGGIPHAADEQEQEQGAPATRGPDGGGGSRWAGWLTAKSSALVGADAAPPSGDGSSSVPDAPRANRGRRLKGTSVDAAGAAEGRATELNVRDSEVVQRRSETDRAGPGDLEARAQSIATPPDDPLVVLRAARSIDGEPRLSASVQRTTRWRARRPRRVSAAEADFRTRLARVLTATGELEQLVDSVPLLADLDALTRAIVDEVADRTAADSIGYWRRTPKGWCLAAHRGLTAHEATWVVPPDQPLFAEVEATGGALLIDPVDRLQAAVAGIGGAHTESFMAGAVAVGPGRYGIIGVGRNVALSEPELDVLADLAMDAAPGVAVAEQLIRLRQVVSRRAAAAPDERVPDVAVVVDLDGAGTVPADVGPSQTR
jgi:hypothetical protein